MPRKYNEKMFDINHLRQTAEKLLKNWGKMGTRDEKGTLNYITSEKVVEASNRSRPAKDLFRLTLITWTVVLGEIVLIQFILC